MITFFGTSRHSALFLKLVLAAGLKIGLVVSAPPKSLGREQIPTENPTVTVAKEYGIPVVLKLDQLDQSDKLELGLILDYNRIIPQSIIDLFPKGIINIHFSKLPQYRGPAPVQAMILNGEKETWISYFLINEKLDEGPILVQTCLPSEGTETTASLYEKLVAKAAEEAPMIVADCLNNKIVPKPQEGASSYAKKLTANEAKIDWQKPALENERLIRAVSPEPGAWTEIELRDKKQGTRKSRLKILKAHLEGGKLVLDQVQLEGKKPVTWKQFKEGHPEIVLSIE